MNLKTKVDDLRDVLARVENKLDEIIKSRTLIFNLNRLIDIKSQSPNMIRYSMK